MNFLKTILNIKTFLRNIDSMYYEVFAYAIITALVMGGFTWIIGLF